MSWCIQKLIKRTINRNKFIQKKDLNLFIKDIYKELILVKEKVNKLINVNKKLKINVEKKIKK